MCGINGFNWKDTVLVEKMNKALKHRGPDGQGTYMNDMVSLGHVRLSIIDLSAAGKQPMTNEDKSAWIVFNGEIYNFLGIRSELEKNGHKFRSKTDTEVIVHAYEEWGPDCVSRFNGMWAFAIYDQNKNILFLSRDRFGIKPLYYFFNEGKFAFSSEIKGLLQHGINRSPNDRVVYEYLALGLIDHLSETFFQGINRVMPGENLVFDISGKKLNTAKWYDLRKEIEKTRKKPENEVIEEIKALFTDAVKTHLISDVPVGSCLSGGIDSSSIVCTMNGLRKNKGIKTFSLVFPGREMDESSYMDEVIKATNVESYKVSPTAENLMSELSDLVRAQEEPFGSLSMYGQYKVMELAHKNGMKVLLDGQGADELFAGYPGYYRYYLFDCLASLKLGEFLKLMHKDKKFAIFLGASLFGKILPAQKILKNVRHGKLGFINDFYRGPTSNPVFERGFGLNEILLGDITTYNLPQLLRYEDKNSMRWSIESRVPFLDYRFVELVAALPFEYKIRHGVTKYAFRKAMDGVVPERILGRRDKIGFATPDREWLKAPGFAGLIRKVIESKEFKSRKYWKQEEVKKMTEKSIPRENYDGILLKCILLELWLEVFIDEKYAGY